MSCMSGIATEFDGTADTTIRIQMYREVNEQKFRIKTLQLVALSYAGRIICT